MSAFVDAVLLLSVIRERTDWLRLLVVALCVFFWVGFFLALRVAV